MKLYIRPPVQKGCRQMKLYMASVFDSAVQAYLPPFYARHETEAMRLFVQACARSDSAFAASPKDYTLFVVGEFDDSSGLVSAVAPRALLTGLQAVSVRTEA